MVTWTGLLLSACGSTFDHKELRARKFPGAEFEFVLARKYRKLALFETDEMYDWSDAAVLGAKRLLLGKVNVFRLKCYRRGEFLAGNLVSWQLYMRIFNTICVRMPCCIFQIPRHVRRRCSIVGSNNRRKIGRSKTLLIVAMASTLYLLALDDKVELGLWMYPQPTIRPIRGNQFRKLWRP